MSTNILFISAGAGSGKTTRLTELLKEAVISGRARPSGVIGTTFTKKAAAELRERVRQHLFDSGSPETAVQMGKALLGTVNSVCGQLLGRFAFEVGLSPDLEVIPDEENQALFDQLLETVVSLESMRRMNDIGNRLEMDDWKAAVKDIVDSARANDMDPAAVRAFGLSSVDELLGFFPQPMRGDPWPELLAAIDQGIAGIESNEDNTQGTKKYLSFLKQIRSDVAEKRLKWSQWVKLSKSAPTKKSLSWSEPVQEAAAQYDSHPMLHDDLRCCCETVFAVAADAMIAYQKFKKKRGLIDFVDQEQLMLKALDLPIVRAVLQEELDLLLVDEFQDTSPIQLALFLKLAEAATEAVFVGDVKQAIYGFRGSDPELMQVVLKTVEKEGGRKEVLGKSYRSRGHLVEYANAVFTEAFSGIMPEDQVRLEAVRNDQPDMCDDTALEKWELKGRNIGIRASELGQGILELLSSGRRVTDPATKQPRGIRFSDIAVFARTHFHIAPLAEAFSAMGIPVNMERPGLLCTPEACLTMACLRRLADPSDTLASAEVVALSGNEAPETWLNNRLEYLEGEGDSYRWGEDGTYPLLQRLATSRKHLQFLTPSEAVALAIDIADMRRLVTAWGPSTWRSALRLNNLDGLVNLARQYEEHCRTQRQAATVGGLLFWFDRLKQKKLDAQPKDLTGDAVTLSTHHGAKGLEWPVVIASDLTDNIWRRLWDLNVVSESGKLDLNDPLADRRLRYWPWPFGRQKTGIPVEQRVENSDWGRASLMRDTEEEKRLLYVSLTRARDLLILPFAGKKSAGPWINTLGADWMVPTADRLQLNEQIEIPTAVREFEASADDSMPTAKYEPFWFDERLPLTEKQQKSVRPSTLPGIETAQIGNQETIGDSIPIKGRPDMIHLGDVLHAAIAARIIDPKQSGFTNLVQDLVNKQGLIGVVEPDDVVRAINQFIQFVKNVFKPKQLWAEYPLVHVWETGQIAKGWIDVLVRTDAEWNVIDHKISKDDHGVIARKYAGQLLAYKKAVEAATGIPTKCWLHFPLTGSIAQVEYP